MRFRFFLTILIVLMIVAAGSVFIHGLFIRQVRLDLVDQEAREIAATLLNSKLNDIRQFDFASAERILADELGESRIGKLFVIRNDKGEIIFENDTAKALHASEMPRSPQWATVKRKHKFIRLLNLDLPRVKDRSLQVGLVLDEDIASAEYDLKSSLLFTAIIIALGSLASLLLTSFLLSPLAKLGSFLVLVAAKARETPILSNVPDDLIEDPFPWKFRDEFRKMVVALNTLIDMINKNYRLSRFWAHQMAHELKTPLAILKLEIEKLQNKAGANEELASMMNETERISETVDSFLDWAELENSKSRKNLFAIRVGSIAKSIQSRLEDAHPGRIQLTIEDDPAVAANPQHIQQLILNLLKNALIYSPTNETVEISVSRQSLCFTDRGPGISSAVLERLGEPFNQGESGQGPRKTGHGLGLAWVTSICRLYGWKMTIEKPEVGTRITIQLSEISAAEG